jgi:replicative DNA helicase
MIDKNLFLTEYQDLDDRLLNGRIEQEGKVIGCLWKNPDLYDDYNNLNSECFTSMDGKYYYALGKKMAQQGYEAFDEITVTTYIQTHEMLRDKFESKGGYENIKSLIDTMNVANIHSYIDDVFKSNIIIGLYNEGFNIFNKVTIKDGEKEKIVIPFELFHSMTSTQVSEWYDWRVQSLTMDKTMGNTKIVDLDLDDKFIEACDSGQMMGLPYDIIGTDIHGKSIYGSPILNASTLGIHKGYTELIGAYSGCGKSSWILAERVMPIIYQNEKVCIIANEMNIDDYKAIILPMILAYHFDYYGLTRKHLKQGGFSEEQKNMIGQAQKYYREHYYGKLKFADIDNYDMNTMKIIVRRMSRQGVGYYIYDTFKAGNMQDVNSRGQLIEASKTLHQLAKKYKVAITIVMQCAIHTENVRYTNSSCLSEAKAVKEVVTQMVLFRKIFPDEFAEEKYDIKPYRFMKDDKTGKWLKTKEYIQLDTTKQYRIFFLCKTRADEDDKCIVQEFSGAWNRWREVAFCTVSHVDTRAK